MSGVNQRFGERLRELRASGGMSQEALGKAVRVSRTAITNIERGNQGVTLDMLYRLAEALNLPPQDLLPPETLGVGNEQVQALIGNARDTKLLMKELSTTQPGAGHGAKRRGKGRGASRTDGN
jgi:transcriptional regulator with XRE-family HTH domain